MTHQNPTCGSGRDNLYVELLEALPSALAFSTGESRARAKVLKRNSGAELICSNDEVTVVNRYSQSFRPCDRIIALKTKPGEYHALPEQAPPDGESEGDCGEKGHATWKVVLDETGTPAWDLIDRQCCGNHDRSCPCATTTTAELTSTTIRPSLRMVMAESTTTTEQCCVHDPVSPKMEITVEDVGREVTTCCEPASACGGDASWSYDVATGAWTLSENDCGAGCEPEEPSLCPNSNSCTKTRCVPISCPTGSTSTTETTESPCPPGGTTTPSPTSTTSGLETTTTCDPTCFETDNCAFEKPDCTEDCRFVCTRSGWIQIGNNCCGAFYIGLDDCPTNPRRLCSRMCTAAELGPCQLSECGQQAAGQCVTHCPPPPSPCGGVCYWYTDGAHGWVNYSGGCAGSADCETSASCGCLPPAPVIPDPCGAPSFAATPCQCLGGQADDSGCECLPRPNCCEGDSTTTSEECAGACSWRWSASGGMWSSIDNTCSGANCNCVGRPAVGGECDGQVQPGFCSDEIIDPPTSTTTTEPSTTTSEPSTTTPGGNNGNFGGCCCVLVDSITAQSVGSTCGSCQLTSTVMYMDNPPNGRWISDYPKTGPQVPANTKLHFWCDGGTPRAAIYEGGSYATELTVSDFDCEGATATIIGDEVFHQCCAIEDIGSFQIVLTGNNPDASQCI